jgi:uncharacterized membrane protein YdjX (TVP38/TMEM64 family)
MPTLTDESPTRHAIALRACGVVVLLATAVASLAILPVRDYLAAALKWVQGLGPLGPVALAALYVPACLFFVPGTILTLGGGFAFGFVRGLVAVSLGSTLGATAAFLAGRTLARGFVERRVAAFPTFAALDRAVARQGFKIVLLARLSPLFPFNVLNYAFGLTQVSLRDYVFASWLGMLPATVLYVYVGSAARSVTDLTSGRVPGGAGQTALFFLGLAATIAVTVCLSRLARQELKRAVNE